MFSTVVDENKHPIGLLTDNSDVGFQDGVNATSNIWGLPSYLCIVEKPPGHKALYGRRDAILESPEDQTDLRTSTPPQILEQLRVAPR